MNSVNGVTGGNTTKTAPDPSRTSVVGQDAFFKMLIAQMKNQDPTNPQEGTEFATQLAQFSSLEQLTKLNATMAAQNQGNANLLNLQSVSLIGKQISAQAPAGADGTPGTAINGQVSAVSFKDNAISLTVNGREVPFGEVLSVK